MDRRRFLLGLTTAGVAIATLDPADVGRRLWPGFSATRDLEPASVWRMDDSVLAYIHSYDDPYVMFNADGIRLGPDTVVPLEPGGVQHLVVVTSINAVDGTAAVLLSGMGRVALA